MTSKFSIETLNESDPMKLAQKLKVFTKSLSIAIVAFVFAAVATPKAQAQADTQVVFPQSGLPSTWSLAAATTNTTIRDSNIVVALPRSSVALLSTALKLQGSGTSVIKLLFDHSVDKTKWVNNAFTQSVTAAGTTEVVDHEIDSIGNVIFIRLGGYENPNAAAATNITIKAIGKAGI